MRKVLVEFAVVVEEDEVVFVDPTMLQKQPQQSVVSLLKEVSRVSCLWQVSVEERVLRERQ